MNIKQSTAKIGNYLRELSIVIIGVAVTLYAGDVIGNLKEQKDLNLQLAAIYTELEFNLERVDEIINIHKRHDHLRESIMENIDHPQQVNDSINKPNSGIGSRASFIYKKGAYEMFINSGAMKLLANRQLLLEITECYIWLESTKEGSQRYYEAKMQELSKLNNLDTKTYLGNIDISDPRFHGIVNFYIGFNGFGYTPEMAKEQIEKTLALLEMR
jgi:hypothetical protein